MKIGFDAKRAFFNETGLGNYSRNLLHGLKKNHSQHSYLLFTPPVKKPGMPQKRLQEFSDFKIEFPDTLVGRLFPSYWRSRSLVSQLERNNIDIYHGLSHEIPHGIEKTPILSVVTVHDLIFMRHPELYHSWDAKIYAAKYGDSIRRADHVIAISENTRKDIVEFIGREPHRVELLYQCADPQFYQKLKDEEIERSKSRHGIRGRYLLSVGSLTRRKNLLNLLDAYAMLPGREELPLLVFVGKGKEYRALMDQKIKEKGLERKVLFLSSLASDELPALYQGADLFLYPSLYEGFGIPVIESFFSRTPVICSGDSCFRETAGDGGYYVDVTRPEEIAGAIKTLLGDATLAGEYAMRGHAYVQRFHQERCAAEMESFYRRILSLKKSSIVT